MKLISYIISIILSVACSTSRTGYDKIITLKDSHNVWVVAHRALTGENKFPENSLATISSCLDHQLDMIEIDVRQTKDGHLVIMHDKTVDRTTNGRGLVADFTLAELRELRLVHEGKITIEKIPTLEEVFKLTKNKILIDLDIKLDTITDYVKIVNLVDKYNMQRQVVYFLYDMNDIKTLHSMSANMRIMPRARSLSDVDEILNGYSYIEIIHLDENSYENSLMKNLILQNKRMWMNSLGKFDQLESKENTGFIEFFKLYPYVNVVQTDLGIQLKQFLEARQLNN